MHTRHEKQPRAPARRPTHILAAATLVLAVALLATAAVLATPLWPLQASIRSAGSSASRLSAGGAQAAGIQLHSSTASGRQLSLARSDGLERGHGGRSLLHGTMSAATYPTCPSCKLIGLVGNWWFGHCILDGALLNCRRRKAGTSPGSPTAPDPTEFDQNLTTTAPFVACLSDADCRLPFDDFASFNRSIPLNTTGLLNADCARPEAPPNASAASFVDLPGICLCKYLTPDASINIIELAVLSQSGEALPAPLVEELNNGLDIDFCFQLTPDGVNLSVSHEVHPFFVPGNVLELPGLGAGVSDGPAVDDPEDFAAGVTVVVSIVDDFYEAVDIYGEEPGEEEEAVGPAGEGTNGPGMASGGNGMMRAGPGAMTQNGAADPPSGGAGAASAGVSPPAPAPAPGPGAGR